MQLQIRSWKCNDRNSALQGYCQFSTPFRVLQASDLKLCLRPEISAMITLFLKERDAYILTSVFAAYTAGSMAGRGSTRQVSGRSGGGAQALTARGLEALPSGWGGHLGGLGGRPPKPPPRKGAFCVPGPSAWPHRASPASWPGQAGPSHRRKVSLFLLP